jgi:hypothetical protein
MSRQLPIRIDEEFRKRLSDEAFTRGISLAALIREKLAGALPWPPSVSRLIAQIEKVTGKPPDWIVGRVMLWFATDLEAERRRTGKIERPLVAFVETDPPMSDEQAFEYLVKCHLHPPVPMGAPAPEPEPDFSGMTDAELIAYAKDLGMPDVPDVLGPAVHENRFAFENAVHVFMHDALQAAYDTGFIPDEK